MNFKSIALVFALLMLLQLTITAQESGKTTTTQPTTSVASDQVTPIQVDPKAAQEGQVTPACCKTQQQKAECSGHQKSGEGKACCSDKANCDKSKSGKACCSDKAKDGKPCCSDKAKDGKGCAGHQQGNSDNHDCKNKHQGATRQNCSEKAKPAGAPAPHRPSKGCCNK